jgi:hypothetical protein
MAAHANAPHKAQGSQDQKTDRGRTNKTKGSTTSSHVPKINDVAKGAINAGKTHRPDESSAKKSLMKKWPFTVAKAIRGATKLPRIRRRGDANTLVPAGLT